MRALKVVIEAPVTSFRYPHFLIGRQVSFDCPPPSTIYGHIASAAGRCFPPEEVRFAYHFTFAAKGSDLEYQHIISRSQKSTFTISGKKYPAAVDGVIQPHTRDFLYGCRLILYIDNLDFAEAFRNPVFAVNLGRSQDLAKILSVEEVDLKPADEGYFEHTILPFSMRKYFGRGMTVLMPKYVGPPPEREPVFDRYIVLHERMFAGERNKGYPKLFTYESEKIDLITDPCSPKYEGVNLALVFHSFAREEGRKIV
jgi:CRISPR-associated protein Cas5t